MAGSDLAAWRPSVVVGSTYLAQGLVACLGPMMLGVLAQLGTPLEDQVGVLASGALPWVLKFALGLLLDLGPSWPLRVRSLVSLILLGGAALATWGLARAWAPGVPESLTELGFVWLALNFAMAMQDTLVDALALDLLADRRALAATGMGLGHAIGFGLLGSWWIGGTIVREGLAAGLELAALALAILAATPLLLWSPGRPVAARERPSSRRDRSPSDWLWLLAIPLLGLIGMLAPNITGAVAAEFLFVELRWEFADYAIALLPLGAIAGVIGALTCGSLLARVGPAWASASMALLLGVLWLVFASLSSRWSEIWLIRSLAFGEGFLQAALLVGLHALALLAAARSPLPITGFVFAMAALNLPRVLGPLLAPTMVEHGWIAVFTGCGALQILAGLGLLPLIRRTRSAGDPPARGIH
ncbi:hypothetical protein ACNOYE_33930 [Nannocystaceae bacterium ST9]